MKTAQPYILDQGDWKLKEQPKRKLRKPVRGNHYSHLQAERSLAHATYNDGGSNSF